MTDMLRPDRLPIARGLRGRCPRCGKGRLFQRLPDAAAALRELRPRFRLRRCRRRPGGVRHPDRAASSWCSPRSIVEFVYQPPYWVHAVLWLPLILIVTLAPLRPIKGLMIALQYHHKAAEGRLERRGDA